MKLLAIIVLSLCGCVRAGFDATDQVPGAPGDGQPAGDRSPAAAGATKLNDSCQSPFPLDLTQLPASFTVDTTGARDDYQHCAGKPELVVQYVNAPGMVIMTCSGGGRIDIWRGLDPTKCPAQPSMTNSLGCTATQHHIFSLQGSGHLFICRDPKQGPATLQLAKP